MKGLLKDYNETIEGILYYFGYKDTKYPLKDFTKVSWKKVKFKHDFELHYKYKFYFYDNNDNLFSVKTDKVYTRDGYTMFNLVADENTFLAIFDNNKEIKDHQP